MGIITVQKLKLDKKGAIIDNHTFPEDKDILYQGSSREEAVKIAKKSLPSILMETIFLSDGLRFKYSLYKSSQDTETEEIYMSDKKIRKICEPYKNKIIDICSRIFGN